MLLWIHPFVQGLTGILALYVLWLGLQRFASRHLKKSYAFQWKRHVLLGKVVVVIWALGAFGGTAVTYIAYGRIFTESLHFRMGIVILLVLLFTWLTGTWLDRHRNESDALPVIHLANNTVLLILVVVQVITGVGILQNALFG